jgi:hypothetical protein
VLHNLSRELQMQIEERRYAERRKSGLSDGSSRNSGTLSSNHHCPGRTPDSPQGKLTLTLNANPTIGGSFAYPCGSTEWAEVFGLHPSTKDFQPGSFRRAMESTASEPESLYLAPSARSRIRQRYPRRSNGLSRNWSAKWRSPNGRKMSRCLRRLF